MPLHTSDQVIFRSIYPENLKKYGACDLPVFFLLLLIGPPTPSKNGGRFSIGSTFDLPRDAHERDVLRESNANKPTEKHSFGGAKSLAKKNTPGKFRHLFTTSKVKDEVRKKF